MNCQNEKQQNRLISTSGTVLDAVKVRNMEEVTNQGTDNDVIE